jgi:hypothetical protein
MKNKHARHKKTDNGKTKLKRKDYEKELRNLLARLWVAYHGIAGGPAGRG